MNDFSVEILVNRTMGLAVRLAAAAGITAAASGCVGEKGEIAIAHPVTEALASVTVSPSAAILAVGQTRQFALTGVSMAGMPIMGFDEVRYVLGTAADSVRLRLAVDGAVSAIAPGNLMLVNVLVERNGEFKGDQALVQVTATPVSGVALSIQPSDSAKLAAGALKTMTPVLRNAGTGLSVPSPVVRYSVRPADAKRVALYRPSITVGGINVQIAPSLAPTASQIGALAAEGATWIHGTVDAYGTLLRDSVLLTFSYPFRATIATGLAGAMIAADANGRSITLAPGATVTFRSDVFSVVAPLLTIAYTFDNPGAATAATPVATVGGASGNITPLPPGEITTRRFLVAGTYRWTAVAAGGTAPWSDQMLTGSIVIR